MWVHFRRRIAGQHATYTEPPLLTHITRHNWEDQVHLIWQLYQCCEKPPMFYIRHGSVIWLEGKRSTHYNKHHMANDNCQTNYHIDRYISFFICCLAMEFRLTHSVVNVTVIAAALARLQIGNSTDYAHYSDVVISAKASQITSVPIVCSTVC